MDDNPNLFFFANFISEKRTILKTNKGDEQVELKKIIDIVSAAEIAGKKSVRFDMETALEIKEFAEARLEIAAKGGRRSRVNTKVSNDPKAIANRERVRAYRARQKGDNPK